MDTLTILVVAVALAMDSFSVAIAAGAAIKKQSVLAAARIGLFFGFFQGFLPVIGWIAGNAFSSIITEFDHWIAFILLVVIGAHMVLESRKSECKKVNYLSCKVLALLGVATSIDALAVGVGFAFLEVDILLAVLLIGIVSFVFSFVGVFIGKKVGCLFKGKAELVGGVVLILIGLRILAEHTLFV